MTIELPHNYQFFYTTPRAALLHDPAEQFCGPLSVHLKNCGIPFFISHTPQTLTEIAELELPNMLFFSAAALHNITFPCMHDPDSGEVLSPCIRAVSLNDSSQTLIYSPLSPTTDLDAGVEALLSESTSVSVQ